MTNFKPNDRVKVVRGSESLTGFNRMLKPTIGEIGEVEEANNGSGTCFVRLSDGVGLYFPTDMLELEGE